MKQHAFKDWTTEIVNSTRKNGKTKYISKQIDVEDILVPIVVSYGNITKTLYYRQSQKNNPVNRFLPLYNEDGSYAKGIWQHGRYGTTPHIEGIEIRSDKMSLVTTGSYASGQIKDQHKYLKSIILTTKP